MIMNLLKKLTQKVKPLDIKKTFFFISILFIVFTNKISASEYDSLKVFISKTDSAYYVDLIFQNLSSDTVIIPAQFNNYYYGSRTASGIMINTYIDKKPFMVDIGDLATSMFKFSEERFVYILPNSSIKYNVNLFNYLREPRSEYELSVDFLVLYLYKYMNKTNKTFELKSIRTNYLVLNNWIKNKYKKSISTK
jgi:hypothetical protein